MKNKILLIISLILISLEVAAANLAFTVTPHATPENTILKTEFDEDHPLFYVDVTIDNTSVQYIPNAILKLKVVHKTFIPPDKVYPINVTTLTQKGPFDVNILGGIFMNHLEFKDIPLTFYPETPPGNKYLQVWVEQSDLKYYAEEVPLTFTRDTNDYLVGYIPQIPYIPNWNTIKSLSPREGQDYNIYAYFTNTSNIPLEGRYILRALSTTCYSNESVIFQPGENLLVTENCKTTGNDLLLQLYVYANPTTNASLITSAGNWARYPSGGGSNYAITMKDPLVDKGFYDLNENVHVIRGYFSNTSAVPTPSGSTLTLTIKSVLSEQILYQNINTLKQSYCSGCDAGTTKGIDPIDFNAPVPISSFNLILTLYLPEQEIDGIDYDELTVTKYTRYSVPVKNCIIEDLNRGSCDPATGTDQKECSYEGYKVGNYILNCTLPPGITRITYNTEKVPIIVSTYIVDIYPQVGSITAYSPNGGSFIVAIFDPQIESVPGPGIVASLIAALIGLAFVALFFVSEKRKSL